MAVDQDKPDPTKSTKSTNPVVRYTLAQRQKDMRTRQYDDESRRTKPQTVVVQEEDLSAFNSKSPGLEEFTRFRFASARRRVMRETPEFKRFTTNCTTGNGEEKKGSNCKNQSPS